MIATWHHGWIRAGHAEGPAHIGLLYYPADAHAITMCVDLGDGSTPTTWRYARSLIDDALRNGHAGIGLVHLAVDQHLTDDPWMWFTVTDGTRTATTALPVRQVHAWLARTYRAIPDGAETIDVNQGLLRLPAHQPRPACRRPSSTRPAGRAPTGHPPRRNDHR